MSKKLRFVRLLELVSHLNLQQLGAAFGLLQIVWFIWAGMELIGHSGKSQLSPMTEEKAAFE